MRTQTPDTCAHIHVDSGSTHKMSFTLCSCILISIQGIQQSIKSVLLSYAGGKRKDESIKVKGERYKQQEEWGKKSNWEKNKRKKNEPKQRLVYKAEGLFWSGRAEPTHPRVKSTKSDQECAAKSKRNGTSWLTSTQLGNTSPSCKLATFTPHSICWRGFGPHHPTLHT